MLCPFSPLRAVIIRFWSLNVPSTSERETTKFCFKIIIDHEANMSRELARLEETAVSFHFENCTVVVIISIIIIYLLQLGLHPVAVVLP
jgi:hypothetical protein